MSTQQVNNLILNPLLYCLNECAVPLDLDTLQLLDTFVEDFDIRITSENFSVIKDQRFAFGFHANSVFKDYRFFDFSSSTAIMELVRDFQTDIYRIFEDISRHLRVFEYTSTRRVCVACNVYGPSTHADFPEAKTARFMEDLEAASIIYPTALYSNHKLGCDLHCKIDMIHRRLHFSGDMNRDVPIHESWSLPPLESAFAQAKLCYEQVFPVFKQLCLVAGFLYDFDNRTFRVEEYHYTKVKQLMYDIHSVIGCKTLATLLDEVASLFDTFFWKSFAVLELQNMCSVRKTEIPVRVISLPKAPMLPDIELYATAKWDLCRIDKLNGSPSSHTHCI